MAIEDTINAMSANVFGQTSGTPSTPTVTAGGIPAAPKPPAVPTAPTGANANATLTPPGSGGTMTGIMPTDASVSSQFNKITASGNPLMKMAEQSGLNMANKRGMLNSTLAIGTAQGEAYKAALPLAQQDAQTAATWNLSQADREAQMERLRISGDQSLAQIGAQGTIQTNLATLNNDAEMSRLHQQLTASSDMQSKDIAAQMQRLSVSGQQEMDRLNAQLAGANAQQQADIKAQMDRLTTSINSDMARLKEQGTQALTQIGAQGQVQSSLSSQDAKQQMDRLNVSLATEMAKLDRQIASAEGQQKLDLQGQKERLQIAGQQELDRLQKASEYDRARVQLQGDIDKALSAQGADQAQALSRVQGGIQSALQSQTDTAAMSRLKESFDHDLQLVDKNIAADLVKIAASGDQNMKQLVQQQQGALQELSMQLASGDRTKVAELAVSIFAQEASMRASLLANTSIPASERAAYEAAISAMGNPVRNYINALYSQPPGSPAPATGIMPPPSDVGGGLPSLYTAPAGGVVAGGIAPTAPAAGGSFSNAPFQRSQIQ